MTNVLHRHGGVVNNELSFALDFNRVTLTVEVIFSNSVAYYNGRLPLQIRAIWLSVCPSASVCVSLSVCLSVGLPACLPSCLSAFLPACLHVSLPLCFSVSLSIIYPDNKIIQTCNHKSNLVRHRRRGWLESEDLHIMSMNRKRLLEQTNERRYGQTDGQSIDLWNERTN